MMDKEQFILGSIGPMALHTFPYITSVLGVVDSSRGEHAGSGLRCIFRGRRAIITACHVIEAAANHPGGIALSAGYGRPPFLVRSGIHFDRIGDLAAYYLPDDYPDDVPEVAFWPEQRIQTSMERLSTDYLFAHGFPGDRSQFLRLMDGVASKSLPYGVMQRLENLPPDFQPFQFALDFDPLSMKAVDSSGETFVAPQGLSGSPVWRIGISGCATKEWTPEHSVVVGFLTQWRPAERLLVATSATRLSNIPVTQI